MDKRKITDTVDPLLIYLSGLFDIGGCVRIETPKKSAEASLFMWITCKNFRVMELLQKKGAHIGQKPDGTYRAKWRDRAAFVMLKRLMPNLIIRKDQAKIGVEFFEEKQENNTQHTDTIFKLRLRLQKRRDSDEGGN